MLITSKEAVWRNYIIEMKDSAPVWKKETPDWIKEAFYFFSHKMHHEEFFALLEAHGVISSDKSV